MATIFALAITGLCAVPVHFINQKWRQNARSREHGCKSPRAYPHKDPLLGLDVFVSTGSAIQQHRYYQSLLDDTTRLVTPSAPSLWALRASIRSNRRTSKRCSRPSSATGVWNQSDSRLSSRSVDVVLLLLMGLLGSIRGHFYGQASSGETPLISLRWKYI